MEIAAFCDASSLPARNVTRLVSQSITERLDVSLWEPKVIRCRGDTWRQGTVPQGVGLVQRYSDTADCSRRSRTEDKSATRFGESLRKAAEVQKYVFANG